MFRGQKYEKARTKQKNSILFFVEREYFRCVLLSKDT